ncbi:hypothetical protein MHK_001961, partial [Candidatus Magnetomorum sp. HK-1]
MIFVKSNKYNVTFAYPNVSLNNEFIGIGEIIASSKDYVDKAKYEIFSRKNINHSEILTASSILANKPRKFLRNIYAKKEDKQLYSDGSMGLAYLLAKIHCAKPIKPVYYNKKIWTTGSPELRGKEPFLSDVFQNQFDVKLNAFLLQKTDKIFFVPEANMKPEFIEKCNNLDIELLEVKQFSKLSSKKIFQKKKIVQVNGNELEFIVDAIFKKSIVGILKTYWFKIFLILSIISIVS